MNTLSTTDVLTLLKDAVSRGGSAGFWIGKAYLSWYRGGDEHRIDLQGFDDLDHSNQILFFEMLSLRKRDGWSDNVLYRTEQELKKMLAHQST